MTAMFYGLHDSGFPNFSVSAIERAKGRRIINMASLRMGVHVDGSFPVP